MNRIFTEFDNENANRTYPFASGCTVTDTDGAAIGTGILIDAAIYPINAKGTVYLSSITNESAAVSDDTGVIMTATRKQGSDVLEFYETGGLGRHVGTILASSSEALDILMSGSSERTFRPSASAFAASCVFPIENDGVLSLNVQGSGSIDGDFEFSNSDSDDIRVSTDSSGRTLRFDALPNPSGDVPDSIRHVYCVVDGKTPFRIQKIGFGNAKGNTIAVYLDNLDRSSICGNAHREDSLEMTDTCDCSPDDPTPVDIQPTYQAEVVDIPNGADSSFYLAVPSCLGYDNPLSLTLTDGDMSGKSDIETETDPTGRIVVKNAIDDSTSNGVTLQVPGMEK